MILWTKFVDSSLRSTCLVILLSRVAVATIVRSVDNFIVFSEIYKCDIEGKFAWAIFISVLLEKKIISMYEILP